MQLLLQPLVGLLQLARVQVKHRLRPASRGWVWVGGVGREGGREGLAAQRSGKQCCKEWAACRLSYATTLEFDTHMPKTLKY